MSSRVFALCLASIAASAVSTFLSGALALAALAVAFVLGYLATLAYRRARRASFPNPKEPQ